jgi:hypothetical protein|tara:strand:- start:4111 stop:5898 length:1788 start_codon:yes stop_codon:yes gene_type:complete
VQKDFKFLKSHTGKWRVDGFGDLRLEDLKRPRINVYFSQYGDERSGEPHFLAKNLPACSVLWLTIGSVWEHGRKVFNPSVQKPVTVDTRSSRRRTLGESLLIRTGEDGGSEVGILPPHEFNLGGKQGNYLPLLGSKFEILKTTDRTTPYIIIPHSEIFRFYYCPSTRLCNSILMGETSRYVDLSGSRQGSSPALLAKTDLTRDERNVFFRMLSDEYAMECLYFTRKMLDRSSIEGRERFIEALIPFKGLTNLTCAGKRMCLWRGTPDYPSVYGLFAMQILSCSYAPSIQEATVVYPGGSGSNKDSAGSPGHQWLSHPDIDELSEIFDLGEQPSDASIARLGLRVPSDRFPAMTKLRHQLVSSSGRSGSGGIGPGEVEHPETISIETGDYSKGSERTVGVDMQTDSQSVDRSIASFVMMLKTLRTLKPDWDVEFIANTDELSSCGERLAVFPAMPASYRWYKVFDEATRSYRPRSAACAKVTFPSKTIALLVEIELRPKEKGWSTALWMPQESEELTEKDLNSLLTLTAVRKRWPKQFHEWEHEKWTKMAERLFQKSTIYGIDHLRETLDDNPDYSLQWAKRMVERLSSLAEGTLT